MSADTTKGDYDARLRELCTTEYGMTPVEADMAEVLHAACWCQSTHDAYADDGGVYEGCGPWAERDAVRGLMAAARPVHYREAAASLRVLLDGLLPIDDRTLGLRYAATRLERAADDEEAGDGN